MSLQDRFTHHEGNADLHSIIAANLDVSYEEVTRWLTAGVPAEYEKRLERILDFVDYPWRFIVEDVRYNAVVVRPFISNLDSTDGAICVTRTMYLPDAIAWVRHHLAVPGETDPVEIQLLF